MIVAAFDPSKSTGWALFDTKRHFSAIECGVFELPAKSDEYFTADQIGQKVVALMEQCRARNNAVPSFAVIEQQMAAQAVGTNFSGSIYPWIATSAITATLANFGIPYGTIAPATWRKQFFGEKYKPPHRVVTLKKPTPAGKTEKIEYLWKDAAIAECQRIGITLPTTKALADDAAEAAAMAICWSNNGMNFHARRYHQPWMSLRAAA